MAFTKVTETPYLETGTKKINGKRALTNQAKQLSSFTLVGILLARHKVALLAIGNIILVLNWAFPEWPELIKSFIN